MNAPDNADLATLFYTPLRDVYKQSENLIRDGKIDPKTLRQSYAPKSFDNAVSLSHNLITLLKETPENTPLYLVYGAANVKTHKTTDNSQLNSIVHELWEVQTRDLTSRLNKRGFPKHLRLENGPFGLNKKVLKKPRLESDLAEDPSGMLNQLTHNLVAVFNNLAQHTSPSEPETISASTSKTPQMEKKAKK